MGYFSNGTEGMEYMAKYCQHCVHMDGCAVWLAHLMNNYKECNNPDSILHILIPREGVGNGKCRMFLAVNSGTEYLPTEKRHENKH